MNVYLLNADVNRHQTLVLAHEGKWDELLDEFDGRPLASSWIPLEVEVEREHGQTRPTSDFPSLLVSHIPVFSQHAVNVLRDVLETHGEILPLICADGAYFAFNVTKVIDALDDERSEFQRFSTGRVMRVVRHEFRSDMLVGVEIFRIPQLHRSPVYATDTFIERIRRERLTGFKPELVWSSAPR